MLVLARLLRVTKVRPDDEAFFEGRNKAELQIQAIEKSLETAKVRSKSKPKAKSKNKPKAKSESKPKAKSRSSNRK